MRAQVCCIIVLALALPAASGADQTLPAANNGRIVFVSANSNGMASMNPDGSGVWGLMLGGSDGEPAWSADGSRLAIAVRWPGLEGITVMDPHGWSNRIRLTSSPTDSHPTWAPDGRTIAYSAGGDIALVSVAGGAPPVRVTTGAAYDAEPAWSPDGRTIAFTRTATGPSSIWTFDVDKHTEALAVSVEPFATAPSWSPRGELTYVAGDDAFVRAPNGTASRLIAPVDYGSSITWSPDGNRFLFVKDSIVFVADRDGSVLDRLVAGRSPAWQPLPPAPSGCTLWGTAGADILVGTPTGDVICGLDGNDTVIGLDGADVLRGGGGNDWVAGGQGPDRLLGGLGADRIDARDGTPDSVDGGADTDTGLLEPGDGWRSLERRRLDRNLAAWRPVRASGVGIPDPPERAVDGRPDDFWNSGGWPPGWIEVDLLETTDIGKIRLVTGPQPAGVTHLVLGKGKETRGAYKLLRTVKGPTSAGQEVILQPTRPWRGIRWLRIATARGNGSSEWVSWHEIEVYAPVRR